MNRHFNIREILEEHNASHVPLPFFERIELFDMNGQDQFPIIGMSGGVCAAAMVYFYVGELDSGDMGRGGLKEHGTGGLSWAVQLPHWMDEAKGKLEAELEAFDQAIRKVQSERLKK